MGTPLRYDQWFKLSAAIAQVDPMDMLVHLIDTGEWAHLNDATAKLLLVLVTRWWDRVISFSELAAVTEFTGDDTFATGIAVSELIERDLLVAVEAASESRPFVPQCPRAVA